MIVRLAWLVSYSCFLALSGKNTMNETQKVETFWNNFNFVLCLTLRHKSKKNRMENRRDFKDCLGIPENPQRSGIPMELTNWYDIMYM